MITEKNETAEKNETEEKFREGRNFFIRTYLKPADVHNFLKTLSVAKFAYILHDKEDCEPHVHIVLRMNNKTSLNSLEHKIKLYGKGRDNGIDVNSNVQLVRELGDCFLYLTHETEHCLKEEKMRYPAENIVSNDIGYFRGDYRQGKCQRTETSIENNAYQIICDMERGETLRNLVRRYGREFVINFQAYNFMYEMIREEECKRVFGHIERKEKQLAIKRRKSKNETDN